RASGAAACAGGANGASAPAAAVAAAATMQRRVNSVMASSRKAAPLDHGHQPRPWRETALADATHFRRWTEGRGRPSSWPRSTVKQASAKAQLPSGELIELDITSKMFAANLPPWPGLHQDYIRTTSPAASGRLASRMTQMATQEHIAKAFDIDLQ